MTKVIFDLDGTLCDSHDLVMKTLVGPESRGEPPDWEAYWAGVKDCGMIIETSDALEVFYAAGYEIEIWTVRSEKCRADTEQWLKDSYFPNHVHLKMSSVGDFRPSSTIKEEWLLSEKEKPYIVFEDNKANTAMFRQHGVMVFQVGNEPGSS